MGKNPVLKVCDLGHDLFLPLATADLFFTPVTLLKWQDYRNREAMSSCQGLQREWAWKEVGVVMWGHHERPWQSWGMFCTVAESTSASWLWCSPSVSQGVDTVRRNWVKGAIHCVISYSSILISTTVSVATAELKTSQSLSWKISLSGHPSLCHLLLSSISLSEVPRAEGPRLPCPKHAHYCSNHLHIATGLEEMPSSSVY